jgi:hypothetical protein
MFAEYKALYASIGNTFQFVVQNSENGRAPLTWIRSRGVAEESGRQSYQQFPCPDARPFGIARPTGGMRSVHARKGMPFQAGRDHDIGADIVTESSPGVM